MEKQFEDALNLQMKEAVEKLKTLLHCGNERVELSAAKELLSLIDAQSEKAAKQEQDTDIQVEIVVRDT